MKLLDAWANWQAGSAPYILEADRGVFASSRSARAIVTITSWAAAYEAPNFGAPGDKKLHLGLLPQPFCGDLRRASIYVLLLNPGLGVQDYYGEYQVPSYRQALLSTLKQEFASSTIPFHFLDPQFAWHGGFGWWHGKLARVIERLAATWAIQFAAARAKLGAELASIELVPYHSASFHDAGGWLRNLQSVALARAFVSEVLVPRVERGDAIAIVTRKARAWDPARLWDQKPRIVRYSGQEARAAHLTPDSPGGKAILQHLQQRA